MDALVRQSLPPGTLDPALLAAARTGDTRMVSALLRQGARPRFDEANQNAVMRAMDGGHEGVVDLLLPFVRLRDKGSLLLWHALTRPAPAFVGRLFDAAYPNDIFNRLSPRFLAHFNQERQGRGGAALVTGFDQFGLLLEPVDQARLLALIGDTRLPLTQQAWLRSTLPASPSLPRRVRL